ncbi:MAG: family N-acetyltransferase [Acidimicrobiales bacterium]|nr:family N-acetyltransferase [Acidimicrobiales bacterium]
MLTVGQGVRPPDDIRPLRELTMAEIGEWSALVVAQGCGYFSSPTWGLAWLDAFGPENEAVVAIWRHEGVMAAVAAMVQMTEPLLPNDVRMNPRLKVWQNLGAGVGGADHLEFPCRPELRASTIAWATSMPGTVRLISFPVTWTDDLPTAPEAVRATTTTYQVPLHPSVTKPGSAQLWSQIGRRRRRLVEQGLVFDAVEGAAIDRGLITELIDLHLGRTAVMRRRSSFTQDRATFHTDLAAQGNDHHRSVMVVATKDGVLTGALYGFRDDRTFSYYQSGWHPRYQQWSLGAVVMGESIQYAQRQGLETFDLLRGDEPYKLRFGAEPAQDISATRYHGGVGRLLSIRNSVATHRR